MIRTLLELLGIIASGGKTNKSYGAMYLGYSQCRESLTICDNNTPTNQSEEEHLAGYF